MSDDNKHKIDLISLYDIQKQGYMNVSPINSVKVYNKLNEIKKWFENKKYVLFLCRELNDYTVFNFISNDYNKAIQDLRECFFGRGLLMDIVYEEDRDVFEIWMKIDKQIFMYLLFDCYDFVIEA